MAQGLGSFAAGLLSGYTQGKKLQQERELRELQLSELRDKRELAGELKKLDTDVKPTEGFVVTTGDGTRTIFADEKAATDAVNEMPGAQMQRRFLVAGQQYETPEQAQEAATAANSPAVKMRQRMELAMKFNQPALAGQFGQAYKQLVDTNRQIVFDQFNQLRAAGDVDGILGMLNSRPGARGQSEIVPTQDGGVALQTTVNGKPFVGQPFATVNDLLDGIGAQISSTPDNFFERNLAQKQFGLSLDKFTHQKGVDEKQLANAATGLGIQSAGLQLRRDEFEHTKTAPINVKTMSGVTPSGDVGTFTEYQTRDPQTGLLTGHATPVQTHAGLKPIRTGSGLEAFLAGQSGAKSGTVLDGVSDATRAAIQAHNKSKAPGPKPASSATTAPPGRGLQVPSDWMQAPGVQELLKNSTSGSW